MENADELAKALTSVSPGEVIGLADGIYRGRFVAAGSGTAERPVWLCGGSQAVLDGDDQRDGHVLHLDGASYWRVHGFTVRNGQKGVMADAAQRTVISGLTVHGIGNEGISLRRGSSDNVVRDNIVFDTGRRRDSFGEGVSVGSAASTWCRVSDCEPDRSDRNVISGNQISATTAENIDILEGTTGGEVSNNRLDAGETEAANSAVDVKGNEWLIRGNTVVATARDGFHTHEAEPGWGTRNTFADNLVQTLPAKGFGIALSPPLANVVTCTNQVPAGRELSKTGCS